MMKFIKTYNLRFVSILVALVFLLNSTAYGIDLSEKFILRVPLLCNSQQGSGKLEDRFNQICDSLISSASVANTSEKLNELIDFLAILPLDVDRRLNIAAQMFAVSPAFLGNTPPFFIPYTAQVFAKNVYNYSQQQVSTRPIVLLSFGIGDGPRIYEKMMFCRALGVKNLQLIGIEYDPEIAQQARTIFPDAKIIIQDLLTWNEDDPNFKLLVGKVDFIDSSFLMHEIYSFGGRLSPLSHIDHNLGQEKVAYLLSKCSLLLRPGGKCIIMDGYLFPNGDDQIEVRFSETYREAYNRLQMRYEPILLPLWDSTSDTILLTRQQLAVVLDKLTFFTNYRRRATSPKRLAREMQERFAFWTEADWTKTFTNLGLSIEFIGHYTDGSFLMQDQENVKILRGDNTDFPRPYQLLIVSKQKNSELIQDPVTILEPQLAAISATFPLNRRKTSLSNALSSI